MKRQKVAEMQYSRRTGTMERVSKLVVCIRGQSDKRLNGPIPGQVRKHQREAVIMSVDDMMVTKRSYSSIEPAELQN